MTKSGYIFDKRGRDMHGDYYEYEVQKNYYFIIKCAFLDNETK